MNIDFPYHIDGLGRTAQADRENHVLDMIEQFLFTNPGERVNRPDFGSGLQQLIFAPNSPELAAAVQFTIQAGLQRWLGDVIQVQALEVQSLDSTLSVFLQYQLLPEGEVRSVVFPRRSVP